MKIWTYNEAKTKILTDLDLLDETFISPNEMIGYFNEALSEAEAEIQALRQDYFLTKYFLPLVTGQALYALPSNIYANKIRALMYSNGSIIYPISQYRRMGKFNNMAFTDQYGASDDYRYLIVNNGPGQSQIELHPVSRETAILPPSANAFTPAFLWYVRNCARVPLVGEYCNPETIAPTQVNTGTNQIQTYAGSKTIGIQQQGVAGGFPGSIAYVTADQVQFQPAPGGTLPSGLVAGQTYFVIAGAGGLIKIASSRANALAGTAVALGSAGTVYFTMQIAATAAIADASLLDIPEYTHFVMQWVKCRCMEKEGDPRIDGATQTLVALKKSMVDTLTEMVEDDDNTIEPDLSFYNEMN